MSHGHYVVKCQKCSSIMEQCRCMSKDKEVRYGICEECNKVLNVNNSLSFRQKLERLFS